MNRNDIRLIFNSEKGIEWKNSQNEPDIDYVNWLEDKVINLQVRLNMIRFALNDKEK